MVTSGVNLSTRDFLPSFLEVLLGAFSGQISIIVSRAPLYKKGLFSKRIRLKQILHESEAVKGQGLVKRIGNYLLTQIKIAHILSTEEKSDTYIFFLAQSLTLPILMLKLMKRRVILVIGASNMELAEFRKDYLLIFTKIEENISYWLADRIVLYSEQLLNRWGLVKYRNKVSIAHRHFLDFNEFQIQKPCNERDDLIGFIGRLSQEKGPLNFIEAIPRIIERDDNLKVLIGGDGPLRVMVEQYLSRYNLNDRANFIGWIPRDDLSMYLNKLKLLVVPSYTEGLPSIILQAMACGTPVLATLVGAVPDLIKDGDNGFFMEDNSPECIAENVIRALNHSNLNGIIKNARTFVEKEFNYKTAVKQYRSILGEV